MRLLRFGTYVFPDQSTYADNFGDLVQRTQRLPGMSGGYRHYGTGASAKEIGSVRASFWLSADTPAAMQAMLDGAALMQTFGLRRLIMRAFGDSNDTGLRWVEAEVSSISIPMSAGTRPSRLQRVEMTFQCADPYWNQLGTESWKWGDGTLWGAGALWGGGAPTYPLPLTANDLVETVGGTAQTYPRVLLTIPPGGSATDFTLQRLGDGDVVLDEISYTGTLNAGDVLAVNARDMSVKLNGADAFTAAFDYARASFFQLMPGANRLRVTFASVTGVPTLRLRYYTRW